MRPLPAEVHHLFLGLRDLVGPELHQAIVVWITQRFDHNLIDSADYTASDEGMALFSDLIVRLLDFEEKKRKPS